MKYLILGGGISGLSAAWFLHKKDPKAEITLIEKSSRLGGWIQTEGSFELGPRTFQASRCPELLNLICEVGLEDQIIFSDPQANGRYLWHQGRLRSLGSFVPGLIPLLLREMFVGESRIEDESIYEFACRKFSPRVAETLFDPMTLGIYGGDIRKLSLKSCFPFLAKGSIVRGMFKKPKSKLRGLFTLRGGMSQLVETLQKKLPMEVKLNTSVTSIDPTQADLVFCALPASMMGPLFGVEIPMRSLSVVGLIYNQPLLTKKGFGYLVPTQEKESLMGMIWDSAVFPRDEKTRLTAMVRPEIGNPTEVALEATRRHLGIHAKPTQTHLFRAEGAIPQFEVGHAKKIAELEARAKGIVLLGNYFQGASVEAAIARSKSLVCS